MGKNFMGNLGLIVGKISHFPIGSPTLDCTDTTDQVFSFQFHVVDAFGQYSRSSVLGVVVGIRIPFSTWAL